MNLNKENGRISMSRLEFWLGFFLFLFIALFVGYVSFVNADNGSALTYVSFAATLISILLALVAMGYTYGESVAQRSKTDRVTAEISRLTQINNTLEDNTDILKGLSMNMENFFEYGRKSTQNTERLLKYFERSDDVNYHFSDTDEYPELDTNTILHANDGTKIAYLACFYLISTYHHDSSDAPTLFSHIVDNLDSCINKKTDNDISLFRSVAIGGVAFAISGLRDGKLISKDEPAKILKEDMFYQLVEALINEDLDDNLNIIFSVPAIKKLFNRHLREIQRTGSCDSDE